MKSKRGKIFLRNYVVLAFSKGYETGYAKGYATYPFMRSNIEQHRESIRN